MSPECPLEECSKRFESHRARAQHIRHNHDSARPAAEKAHLHELYVVDDLTQTQIAAHYGVAQGTVGNWLREYGITKATRLQADD